MNFYIDPYILTIDKDSITENQLEIFIENLIDWKKIIDLNWGNVFKPAESFEILFENELYPLIDTIKELINKFNIEYIQPEEIDKIINIILSKLPTIEESSQIDDILFDDIDLELNRIEGFTYLLKKIATHIQLDCFINQKEPSKQIILSKELSNHELTFDTIITLIDSKKEIITPYQISVNLSCFENFKSFCSITNASNVWKYGHSQFCLQMALCIKLFQITQDEKYLFEQKFSFMDSFHESAKRLGFKHEISKIDMLLRTLTEDILHMNMQATHELRAGRGANNPQVSHNDYSAWRRDVDYEYHLHYWKRMESIVFANVVNHNNFKITKF
jgi:hypothetical protein